MMASRCGGGRSAPHQYLRAARPLTTSPMPHRHRRRRRRRRRWRRRMSPLVHIATTTATVLVVLFLPIVVVVVAPPPPPPGDESGPDLGAEQIRRLEMEAFAASSRTGNHPAAARKAWRSLLKSHPRSLTARIQLGILYIANANSTFQERGVRYLEETFDASKVDGPLLPIPGPQSFVLAQTVGRYRWQRKEYGPARKYLEKAKEAKPNDVCTEMLLASTLDVFPASIEEADLSAELYGEGMDALVRRAEAAEKRGERLELDEMVINAVPGAKTDPYVHCLVTLFYHSFYYRSDAASSTAKHYEVAAAVWPELLYTHPALLDSQGTLLPVPSGDGRPCVQRKLRLGVASGFLSEGSSVTADFQGVLRRLDRDVFEVTYIYFNEQNSKPAELMFDERDSYKVYTKEGDGHGWMDGARREIGGMELDVLLYLDLTMSSFAHRMGMSRLAPVQAVSHGHPMTSGLPRSSMDYYVSWGAAELPIEVSRTHYTEKLVLLPAASLHQYYDRRITDDGRSANDGLPFRHLVDAGREAFLPPDVSNVDPEANWYLCMQKPFKLHPEFDPLVCSILAADPNAVVLLHEEDRPRNRRIFRKRLEKAGCDLDRVAFIPKQPHHRLLALYALSDVVLDSYPAGGCTTTREVLELGKAVVTLPARYLGSRWSLGYYSILNDSALAAMVVASTPEEYVRLAVRLGTNSDGSRDEAELRIRDSVRKLFGREEAVRSWTDALLGMSPVRIARGEGGRCDGGEVAEGETGGGDGGGGKSEL